MGPEERSDCLKGSPLPLYSLGKAHNFKDTKTINLFKVGLDANANIVFDLLQRNGHISNHRAFSAKGSFACTFFYVTQL